MTTVKVEKAEPEEAKDLDKDFVLGGLERIRDTFGLGTREQFVYFVSDGTGTKIGESGLMKARMATMQSNNRLPLELVHKYDCTSAKECEGALHTLFSHVHDRGEWYLLTPMHLAAIKNILKPLKRKVEADKEDPDELAQQDRELLLKKRKKNFEDCLKLNPELFSEADLSRIYSDQLLARPNLDPADYHYLPKPKRPYHRKPPQPPQVQDHDQKDAAEPNEGSEATPQSYAPILLRLAPSFNALRDGGVTEHEAQKRLLRLLQYRLFSRAGWPSNHPVDPRHQALIDDLQILFDPSLDKALCDLLVQLGLASVLPPPFKDQQQVNAAKEAQRKLLDERYKVVDLDRRQKGFLRVRVPLTTFTKKNDQLLQLCAAVVQCAGMPPFRGKPGKLSSVFAVRSLFAGLFDIRVRKTQRPPKKDGQVDDDGVFFWLEIDDDVLSWLHNFEKILNSV
jgi:hypothetical protein